MNLNKCVLSFLNTTKSLLYRKLYDVDGVEICDASYKVGNEPPADGWRPYDVNIPLTGDDAHFWLRTKIHTPSISENEYLVLRTVTGREGMWDATNPQGLLYLNGKMTQGLDTNHTEAFLDADTDYTVHNYFHMGTYKGGAVQCKMALYSVDRDLEHLYYDVLVPYDAAQMLDEGDTDYARIMSALVDAVRLVDFRTPYSAEFGVSVRAAIDLLEREFYQKLCTPDGKPVVHCIGHTHIDVEWKWARAQTREKIQRSFSTAKSLMDRYPEFKFMLSQPNLYRYLKEEAPEKYEELKALVAEGRWEPEGAMYVEPDCNLTSGESLVRQIIFGKRFFREEFGVESKALFLPDVFGYSAALPQILRKSGVDYFITSKISWNDTNTMPMDMFYWEGIDGTEIFTSFITAQNFGGIPGKGGKNRTTYNGIIDASSVKGTWDRFQQKEYTNSIFMTFGHGDGGGGPTKAMLETQRRTARGIPSLPVTKTNTLIPYLETVKGEFDATAKRTDRTPRWVGELYLEFHRGTYTSIAKVKKANRYSEFLLGNAEALSATDLCLGGSYDTDGLNKLWRKVLHNQFHDILPGSSIQEVYDGTDKDYAQIDEYGTKLISDKLGSIAGRINTDGGILLYNPTGFERPAVLTEHGYTELEQTVPAFGWTVIKDTKAESKVSLDGLAAENEYYKLVLNEAGQIESLYDKRVGRNILTGKANALEAYEDYPTKYDAWEFEDYYSLKTYALDGKAKITPVVDGTRAGFVIEKDYMSSTIKQTMWLYSESARIDFETEIDWHEHHQVLKAIFPVDVHALNATFDVQYGHVSRPTHKNTSWDAAKFETYAHKWADLSENGYGVAILNNGKYGHAVDGSKMSITLVKSATDPYPEADQGVQTFTYSLYPHVDDFRRGGVIEESFVLNQPLYEKAISANSGDLAESYSFVSTDSKNAVITAVKKAECDDGLVVRFYDAYDCKSRVTLTVPAVYSKAYICDLMENTIEEIPVIDGRATVPASNFEIVTVKFYK